MFPSWSVSKTLLSTLKSKLFPAVASTPDPPPPLRRVADCEERVVVGSRREERGEGRAHAGYQQEAAEDASRKHQMLLNRSAVNVPGGADPEDTLQTHRPNLPRRRGSVQQIHRRTAYNPYSRLQPRASLDADADLEALLRSLADDWQLDGQDDVVWDGDRVAAVLRGGGPGGKPEVVRFAAAQLHRGAVRGKRPGQHHPAGG